MKHHPSLEVIRGVSGAQESYVFTLGLCQAHLVMMSLLIVAIAVSVPKFRPEPGRRGGELEEARTS